ncbi:MAG: phosphatidate cytidylyltransferase [Lachnospiraceae bacterium]|nr:phosphatidate cytidylyltransferase [Lachnospiraceae bacterium]
MFKTRLLSGIVLVILIAAALIPGGYVTLAAMLIISYIGVFELLRVYGLETRPIGWVSYVATGVLYVLLACDWGAYVLPLIIAFIIVLLGVYVFAYPSYTDKEVMVALFSFMYVALMLSYVYRIRQLANGGALVVMVFICSWVNDTLAYCAGVTMGKHKMSPKLSPKKSIEGLIGGLLGSFLVGLGYGFFFAKQVEAIDHAPIIFAVAGLLGAAVSVIGDLAASAIKRNNDIKDYGTLIPGHGGILDRFDSIIITAPIVYYCFAYML